MSEGKNRVELVVRDMLRMSYADFARLIGSSPQLVANWKKRGGFPLNRRTIERLSQKTGLPKSVFVSLD